MTRAQAFEVVRSHGGTPSQTVTRQTNVLVVGELGWPLLEDGRPSNKLTSGQLWDSSGKRTPLSRVDRESCPVLNLNGQHAHVDP